MDSPLRTGVSAGAPQILAEIFRVVLDLADDEDPVRLRRITTAKWDSLAHVSLIAAIETEFGLTLDSADTARLTSFQAARLLIQEKIG